MPKLNPEKLAVEVKLVYQLSYKDKLNLQEIADKTGKSMGWVIFRLNLIYREQKQANLKLK